MWIKPRFVYPLAHAPRTAVISRVLRSRGSVRVFENPAAVPDFAPEALAGTLGEIESLEPSIRLTHAMIVFRGAGEPRLTDADRDRLWRRFQVPIFEQILAPDGTLVAWECEAHGGLHVVKPLAALDLDRNPCACGNRSPKIAEPLKTRVAAST